MTGDRGAILGSPARLGRLRLRNRIVCLPHGLHYSSWVDCLPTDRHRAYYQARAEGGAALVCCESSVSSFDGQTNGPLVLSGNPECVPGYQRIADAVHAAGSAVGGQITHYGASATTRVTRQPLIGPSALPDPADRQLCRPMEEADLARVAGDFVAAAENFAAAGFDSIEIKVAHDGLLRQFLSPLTNQRTDRYGGDPEGRIRYVLEIAESIRGAIPDEVALGVRFVADEVLVGGYSLGEGLQFARMLDASGLFDYINSDVGTTASVDVVVPPMGLGEGFYSEQAIIGLAEACETAVIAAVSMRTPEYASSLLAEGHAEAVGFARAMIADPEWGSKAIAGEWDRIRPCTSCNELCVGNSMAGLATGCTVNPDAGFEGVDSNPGGEVGDRVLVVGGGAAGMEAARVAAAHAREVVLVEAEDSLGGQLRLAGSTSIRRDWSNYLRWLEAELDRLEVEVRLGQPMTQAGLDREQFDRIVLATGSTPTEVVGASQGDVISIDDYLIQRPPAAAPAIVDMDFGGPAFWAAAVDAAVSATGKATIVARSANVMDDVDPATAVHLLKVLAKTEATILLGHRAETIGTPSFVASSLFDAGTAEVEADLVIAHTRRRPNLTCKGAAVDSAPAVVVGDALVPRRAAEAVREGQLAGAGLI